MLGNNGIGKTNLLESVEFLSHLKSSRSLSDKDLINNSSEKAYIIGQIDHEIDLKINLFRNGGKKIYINDCLLKKQSDIKTYIRSVCFSANDINIVRGEPSYRRTWLDKVVFQIEPIYLELIQRFNKILKQRSHFWKSKSFQESSSLIDSFDSQIALIGTRIFRRRRRALERIRPYVEYWHNHLSKSKEKISINYLSSIDLLSDDDEIKINQKILDNLLKQRALEKLTGKCVVGPHRDEIEFLINDISIRKFGSSGQQRTMILALKMAELDLLKNIINLPPLLILDDVLAELDVERQKLLLNSVGKESQCLISATHLDEFNKSFLENSQIIYL